MIKQENNRVFSAIQPTGELHIGNYLGALKNFVELQNRYECFFFIADYHSITENYNPKEKSKQILNLAMDFLAAGLDPKKCVIAVQSDICEHTELAWIFNTITPMGLLERMTQYKDKAARQKQNINVGLFDYPVLMAADILIYKTGLVPVGQDQIQHLELSRNIAHLFNNKFGETFPEPKPILTETPKIMSLTDPTKKMSKSLGPKSYIGINDSPEMIKEKIKGAVTATDIKELIDIGIIDCKINKKGEFSFSFLIDKAFENELETAKKEGASVSMKFKGKEFTGKELIMAHGVANLYILLNNFGTNDHKKYFYNMFEKQDIKFSELKETLAQDIADYFAPFRAKRKELEAKPEYVKKVLADGAARAKRIASETMREVKEKIGLSA
ncbi:tryptophan--tRNA ligase [Patescibacteria group bacterium]|nr:tryptophan--tRNA ligase [Patescibacteria group bacterium]